MKLLGLKRRILHHKVAQQPQICPELAQKLPEQNHPQNGTFRSARGSDGCYIGYQPLCFHSMTLSKVFRAQEGVPTYTTKCPPSQKNHLDWPKTRPANITPQIAGSALSGDPTAVTSVTNHSSFQQMTLSKVLRIQEGLPASQSGSPTANTA